MNRRSWLRALLGVGLLIIAVGSIALLRGVTAADRGYRDLQEPWQSSLLGGSVTAPDTTRRVGERLLGVTARADALRAYRRYRIGLANVIEGTVYPQTQARFDAVKTFTSVRDRLDSPADRASIDVVVGAVQAASAASAGSQRSVQLRRAIASFTRAVRTDPDNATAKLDLEALLRAKLARAQAQARAVSTSGRGQQRQQDPKGPPAPTQNEGAGF